MKMILENFQKPLTQQLLKRQLKGQLVQVAINDLFGKYDLMRVNHESVIFMDKILQKINKVDTYLERSNTE